MPQNSDSRTNFESSGMQLLYLILSTCIICINVTISKNYHTIGGYEPIYYIVIYTII